MLSSSESTLFSLKAFAISLVVSETKEIKLFPLRGLKKSLKNYFIHNKFQVSSIEWMQMLGLSAERYFQDCETHR